MKTTLIAGLAALVLAGPAYAAGGHCDADMAAVKAGLAKAKLSDADMKTVNDALAKATELDKAGKEEDCEKSLGAAQKLVGVQEQHKIELIFVCPPPATCGGGSSRSGKMASNSSVANTDQGHSLLCPACKVDLVMSERQGIEIDYCPKCRGVWLDRGELDKIIEKSTGEADQSSGTNRIRPSSRTIQNREERIDDVGYGYGSSGHHGNRSKHGSFLRRLFD